MQSPFKIKDNFPSHLRLEDFARIFAPKLDVDEKELSSSLWGDFYYNSKLKKITAGASAKAKKPLFVQIILENLWNVYDAISIRKDKVMLDKIVHNLNLKIHARDLRHSDARVKIQAVLGQWLPLSDAILSTFKLFHKKAINFLHDNRYFSYWSNRNGVRQAAKSIEHEPKSGREAHVLADQDIRHFTGENAAVETGFHDVLIVARRTSNRLRFQNDARKLATEPSFRL